METPRFELRQTPGGAWLIRDNKDMEVVFFVHRGKKTPEHIRRMVDTTLAALNAAVTRKAAPRQGVLQ